MQHERTRRALWLCLPCLILTLAFSASARDGRDFTAAYRVSHVTKDGAVVHLTMTVKIFNGANADIHNGTVALMDDQPNRSPLGGFAPIKLFPVHEQITLRQTFNVPMTEYRRWRSGGQPNLMFLSKEHGVVRTRAIQLSNREPWSDTAGQ